MARYDSPLVSVVIPVYNVEQYLEKCIASVINQTFTDYELILVDDGSTDGSGDMIDEWSQRDDRIRVIHKDNGGLSSARNCGIETAVGKYLTFIDSDDYVAKEYLEVLVSIMEEHPGETIAACGFNVVYDEWGKEEGAPGSETMVFDRFGAFREVLYHGVVDVCAWAKMYRRALFDNFKFPTGRLYEDTWLFGHLLNASDRYVLKTKPLYNYVKRNGSIVSGGFSNDRMQYIDAVDELIGQALQCDDSLERACVRRWMHARMSVLRYMKNVDKRYRTLRQKLREEALTVSGQVLRDANCPMRDRLGVMSLRLGFPIFYLCWDLYERLRR